MHFLVILIISVVILVIYNAIRKRVSRSFELKDTDINTDLREFRESHTVATVIKKGALNIRESIVQRYERMCILEPGHNKNDPSIPQLIKDYQDIITGRVSDPEGLNVPSEELLGRPNPDYNKYLAKQALALKNTSTEAHKALRKEVSRIKRNDKEDIVKNQFYIYMVDQGIPLFIVIEAMTDAKLNTYTAENWKAFCKSIKGYLSIADRNIVQNFVGMFDDKDVILSLEKFETFVVFHQYDIPKPILVELIKGRITNEQAIRIIHLNTECDYEWDEAMTEVLSEDIQESEEEELRKKYGWKG